MKKTIYLVCYFGLLNSMAKGQCNPVFPTSLTASSSTVCGNGVVTLNATGGSPSLGGGTAWQWINVTGANCLTGSPFGASSNIVPSNVNSPQIVGGLNQFKLKVTGGACGTTGQCSGITVNVTGITSANVVVPSIKLFCPSFSTAITATVTGATSMQWYKGGNAVPGATMSTLTFTNPVLADAGNYQLATVSPCGNATSTAVTFTTIGNQGILGVSSTQVGSTNTFSVINASPLSFNWSIAGSGTITSATNTNSISVNAANTAGAYTVSLVSSLNTCSVTNTKTVAINTIPPALWLKYTFNLGTTINDLGANNTGTLSSGTLTNDRFGNVGQAYNSANIDCGSVPSYSNASELTVAGWFKKPALNSDYAMFNFGGFYSRVYAGGGGFQNAPFSYNTSTKYTTPTIANYTAMPVGTWFHYAHVVEATSGGTLKAYIDGVLVGSATPNSNIVGVPAINNSPLILGGSFQTNLQWQTDYDDIFVVNRALTQTQIDSLKNLPNPGQSNTTNIKTQNKNQLTISVFPNPANDFVNVTVDNSNNEQLQISLLNTLGQVIIIEESKLATTTLKTGKLGTGVYFIKVDSKTNSAIKKFVKQ